MAQRSPNLVFVFPDQWRGSALGFRGLEPVHTPHLDRFARESLVLTEAASCFPVCSPYRAMMLTGQYPARNGVTGVCESRSARFGVQLAAEARCWSDVLAERGYSLGYIGKWHLDAPREPYVDTRNNQGNVKWNEWCSPERRHNFDYWYAYGTYDEHMRPMYWKGDAGRDEFHYVDQWGPEHEADMAIRYLRNENGQYRDAERPFALVVAMNPPHMPYAAHPERYLEPYAGKDDEALCGRPDIPPAGTHWGDHYRRNIRDYYASISGVDEQFGRILQELDGQGLADNTLVIFTSDHGDCLGIHDHFTKTIWWEASMQVPFMARLPGRLKPGTDDLLINSPDICPTLLGLLGLEAHIPASVMGVDYCGVLRKDGSGAADRPRSQLYQWLSYEDLTAGVRGIRSHRWKLAVVSAATLRQRDEGTERLGPTEAIHLYDRQADPFELHNLADSRPDVVRALIAEELKPWLKRAEDPFRLPDGWA